MGSDHQFGIGVRREMLESRSEEADGIRQRHGPRARLSGSHEIGERLLLGTGLDQVFGDLLR